MPLELHELEGLSLVDLVNLAEGPATVLADKVSLSSQEYSSIGLLGGGLIIRFLSRCLSGVAGGLWFMLRVFPGSW